MPDGWLRLAEEAKEDCHSSRRVAVLGLAAVEAGWPSAELISALGAAGQSSPPLGPGRVCLGILSAHFQPAPGLPRASSSNPVSPPFSLIVRLSPARRFHLIFSRRRKRQQPRHSQSSSAWPREASAVSQIPNKAGKKIINFNVEWRCLLGYFSYTFKNKVLFNFLSFFIFSYSILTSSAAATYYCICSPSFPHSTHYHSFATKFATNFLLILSWKLTGNVAAATDKKQKKKEGAAAATLPIGGNKKKKQTSGASPPHPPPLLPI
jgi:hypothetical protein